MFVVVLALHSLLVTRVPAGDRVEGTVPWHRLRPARAGLAPGGITR